MGGLRRWRRGLFAIERRPLDLRLAARAAPAPPWSNRPRRRNLPSTLTWPGVRPRPQQLPTHFVCLDFPSIRSTATRGPRSRRSAHGVRGHLALLDAIVVVEALSHELPRLGRVPGLRTDGPARRVASHDPERSERSRGHRHGLLPLDARAEPPGISLLLERSFGRISLLPRAAGRQRPCIVQRRRDRSLLDLPVDLLSDERQIAAPVKNLPASRRHDVALEAIHGLHPVHRPDKRPAWPVPRPTTVPGFTSASAAAPSAAAS